MPVQVFLCVFPVQRKYRLDAPLSVVNALLVALAAGREEVLADNFNTLERVWEEYNVYEKRNDGSDF